MPLEKRREGKRSSMERIISSIQQMSGTYHSHEIFQDWVQMLAIAISNQVFLDEDLEKHYVTLAHKYTHDQLMEMCEMGGVLIELFEKEISDYLGAIYMKLEAGSKRTGQFFTPFHLCEMMARVALVAYDGKPMTINEPSVGGGGNILAVAKVLKEKGFNYQEIMHVIGQDLDFKCVYMSYVQFSMIGLNAKVLQGDTLTERINKTLYTPMYVLKGGFE